MRKDLVVIGLIVAILTLMVVPLGQSILDAMITLSISLSVLLLMVAVYLKHPSDFSTFPSVILLGTALRLALSVATTRAILSETDGGAIIQTFGDFVVAGSVAIGLIMFLIITVVQFLVVTKGAERVAEVGARFALDALPGKQMSIDADLRAGNIEQSEASARRERLNRDSQFFGAMDGAMKFVKGDAVAGLIITFINLIGGIAIGMSVHGLGFSASASVYSLLTIGDGLVAQIPALIMSLCAGIIVTRATNADNVDLGSDIFKELISDPRVPAMAALIILAIGFIPGFPLHIFAASAVGLFMISLALRRAFKESEASQADGEEEVSEGAATEGSTQEDIPQHQTSGRLICQVGQSIAQEQDLEKIRDELDRTFDQLAATRGVMFLPARIDVLETLDEDSLQITLDDVPVRKCKIPSDRQMLSMEPGMKELLGGTEETVLEADWNDNAVLWVAPSVLASKPKLSAKVLDIEEQVAELIYRVYEQNLGALFSKVEFEGILKAAGEVDQEAVQALEAALTRPHLFQIMRILVEDGVPLRPLNVVIDGLTYWNQINEGAGPVLLSECLRGSLKRQMCHAIAGEEGVLGLAMVDPRIEAMAREGLGEVRQAGGLGSLEGLIFDAETSDFVLGQFRSLQAAQKGELNQLVVVVSSDLRRRMRNFLAANRIHLPILAPHEISNDVKSYPVEMIGLEGLERSVDPYQDVDAGYDKDEHDFNIA